MNVKEAAARLGVSPATVYALCAGKQLTHHRIGLRGGRGKVVITDADIVAFLEATKVEAERPAVASAPYVRPALKHIRLGPKPPPKKRS